jgi:hypothetical protein
MKKLTPLSVICIISILLSACNTPSFFAPALNGNSSAYMPRPMGTDSVKSKTYISGSFAGLTLPYSTGQINMGMLNVSRSNTFKYVTISYGAFGAIGETRYNNQFKKTNTTSVNSYRGLAGGGIRTSIALYDKVGKNLEFRIFSWENSLSFENGAYSRLRKDLSALNDPFIISSTKTTLFTTGWATELIWHTKDNLDNQIGLRIFAGVTPGLAKSYHVNLEDDENEGLGRVGSLSLYFKTKRVFGIFDVGGARGFAGKFTLGYTF